MAQLISLAAYSVKLWDTQEKEADPLSNFADSDDFFTFSKDLLNGLKEKTQNHEESQRVLTVKKLGQEDRTLFGVIETGEYGVESDLLNVATGSVVHRRKKDEADMRPFYFLLDIPDGPDEGILILQRSGVLGIRKIVYQTMKTKFELDYPEYRLRISPLVEAEEFEKYLKGKIESIRFVRFGIPSDIIDAYDSGHKETEGYVELVVHARKGKSLPLNNRLKQVIAGKRTVSELIELTETHFEYENVKVQTKLGGSSRTLDFTNRSRLRSYHDITAQVHLDKNGHPKFDSIHELSLVLLENTRSRIYPKVAQ